MTGTGVPPVPGGRQPGGVPGRSMRGGLPGSDADQMPGSDADQMVAALYHAHYGSLARIAALLVGDGVAWPRKK